jgi:hypothetical protein
MLRLLHRRVLGKIFGTKNEKARVKLEKLLYENLHVLC